VNGATKLICNAVVVRITNDNILTPTYLICTCVCFCFSGYAYDAGMRVGDKLLAIDDFEIKPTTAVDEVRNHLRGEPGTPVSITFLREGVGGGGGGGDGKKGNEPQTITLNRSVVRIPDVKYFGEFVCCMLFGVHLASRPYLFLGINY
jgi:hypothetical protein